MANARCRHAADPGGAAGQIAAAEVPELQTRFSDGPEGRAPSGDENEEARATHSGQSVVRRIWMALTKKQQLDQLLQAAIDSYHAGMSIRRLFFGQ
jgi:hypothetical protein